MKKTILVSISLLSAIYLGADTKQSNYIVDPRVKELTRQEVMALPKNLRQQYMQKLVAIKSGGLVSKEGTGKGSLKIITSIPEVDSSLMTNVLAKAHRVLKIDISIVNGEAVTIETAKESLKKHNAQAGVFVVKNPSLPRLMIAPEEGWGIVNVTKCSDAENDNTTNVAARVRKEILRALALASGAGNSGNVMQPVVDLKSLDEIMVEALPLQARNAMLSHLSKLGIEPVYETSYFKACKEGWAPVPTNDVQKAIWEQVKAEKERGPTNPITIQPPNKK